MIRREDRLRRLAELRLVQHDAAVMHLRGAQTALHSAETEVSQAEAASRHARLRRNEATESGSTQDWLLSCAEAELCSIGAMQRRAARAQASGAVQDAAAGEAAARRNRKQIDVTLDRVKREMHYASVRAEQRTLDEAVRLLKHVAPAGAGQHRTL